MRGRNVRYVRTWAGPSRLRAKHNLDTEVMKPIKFVYHTEYLLKETQQNVNTFILFTFCNLSCESKCTINYRHATSLQSRNLETSTQLNRSTLTSNISKLKALSGHFKPSALKESFRLFNQEKKKRDFINVLYSVLKVSYSNVITAEGEF